MAPVEVSHQTNMPQPPLSVPAPRCQRRSARDSRWQPDVRGLTARRPIVAADTKEEDDMSQAIEAEGLVKRFGKTLALDGVSLSVPVGKVLGVLGPNGAGKTTAVRVLATLLTADA